MVTGTSLASWAWAALVRAPTTSSIAASRCGGCGIIGRPILPGGAHEALDHSAWHRLDDLPGPVRSCSRGGRRAGRHGDVGRSHHPGVAMARPSRDRGDHHAVHVPLRAARRGREADAGRMEYAEPGRVVEPVEGRADV